jgi:hypothetical protein
MRVLERWAVKGKPCFHPAVMKFRVSSRFRSGFEDGQYRGNKFLARSRKSKIFISILLFAVLIE